MPRLPRLLIVTLALLAATPIGAAAQAFGIGPRLSFVRGDLPSDTPSSRFIGGIIRMRSSKRVVMEAALDHRTELSEDGLTRIRERPIQGSLLLFPVKSTVSPYVLVGYGLYTRTTQAIDLTGTATDIASERETGAHMGFGAELSLGRHAAFLLDYRYRFVRFGEPEPGDNPVNLPGLSNRLSHRGSMWTSGMAFYF